MKKTLFSVFIIALFAAITSCQSNQKETTQDDPAQKGAHKDTIASQNSTAANPNTPVDEKIEAPKFSSEEVNEGFAQFEPLKQEYIAAVKSKDAAKIKAINDKYIEWVKVAANWGSKLTKEELQIYINHYTKLVNQWDAITPKVKK